MLPTNPDFQRMAPLQAYWYYFNMINDSEELDQQMRNSGGESYDAGSSMSEFISAVKKDRGIK